MAENKALMSSVVIGAAGPPNRYCAVVTPETRPSTPNARGFAEQIGANSAACLILNAKYQNGALN